MVEQETRVRNLRRAILYVLDEDEDVELMCLSYWRRGRGKNKDGIESGPEQMEMLLEAYLQELNMYANDLELMRLDLEATENLVSGSIFLKDMGMCRIDDDDDDDDGEGWLTTQFWSTCSQVWLRLDSARNQLLTVTTVFTFFSFFVACANMVAGLFGMNLNNGWNTPEPTAESIPVFQAVCSGTSSLVMVLTIIVYAYLKHVGVIVT